MGRKGSTNRAVDDLGRVVIPKEMRKRCGMNPGDPVEFTMEGGETIVMRRYRASCVFCGAKEQIDVVLGRTVCLRCLEQLKNG